MKLSKRQREIEARKAADPLAQAVGRDDIDYENPDELPTAPRAIEPAQFQKAREAKYPISILDDLLVADEITLEQYERLRRENK